MVVLDAEDEPVDLELPEEDGRVRLRESPPPPPPAPRRSAAGGSIESPAPGTPEG